MIELFFAPTPNGWKISIMLEECGLPYQIRPLILSRGDQFDLDFLKIGPNNRIPAMIDHDLQEPEPVSIFESGAILLYLAEKTGSLLPSDAKGRRTALQWLMWQMSGLGPMLGQHGHFFLYASEQIPYAIERYRNEAQRLYGVLDRRLAETGAFIVGDEYSIVDIACFPWIMTHKAQNLSLSDYPAIQKWFATVRARDAVQRGIAAGKELFDAPLVPTSEEERKVFFGLKT